MEDRGDALYGLYPFPGRHYTAVVVLMCPPFSLCSTPLEHETIFMNLGENPPHEGRH